MFTVRGDVLTLANELDAAWHGQTRCFEREALTRFWALLTLPARVLNLERPRNAVSAVTVLRNARFHGDAVRAMFFDKKEFTEVDAIFLGVGSPLGHQGKDAWIVEVERKTANQSADYYLAIERARHFANLFSKRFQIDAKAAVIYDGDSRRAPYSHSDVMMVPMSTLRERTQGLSFSSLSDLPGLGSDTTLVKLALLRQLAQSDPNHAGAYRSPLQTAREAAAQGHSLYLPVVGHQDADKLPTSVDEWLRLEREDDAHLGTRIERYFAELRASGELDPRSHTPRLSYAGGGTVLKLLIAERESVS